VLESFKIILISESGSIHDKKFASMFNLVALFMCKL